MMTGVGSRHLKAGFSHHSAALSRPAHGARAGLAAKMNMLAHPKGPMWVCRNGVDVNLGGSGSESRAINNGLTCIQEEPDDSDDVMQCQGQWRC